MSDTGRHVEAALRDHLLLDEAVVGVHITKEELGPTMEETVRDFFDTEAARITEVGMKRLMGMRIMRNNEGKIVPTPEVTNVLADMRKQLQILIEVSKKVSAEKQLGFKPQAVEVVLKERMKLPSAKG